MRRILVPYHHAEPLPALAEAFAADDAVVVSKGPAGAMSRACTSSSPQRVAAAGEPVVVASGDCTTALGTVAGLQARGLAPGVIWLDAHGDFHTPRTTRSGYFGGMALAMLTGRAGASLARAIGLRAVPEEACALVGARDLDPPEVDALAASRVRAARRSPSWPTRRCRAPPWYVHLDVDVLDPAGLPPLRFPAPGGPAPDALAARAARARRAAARSPRWAWPARSPPRRWPSPTRSNASGRWSTRRSARAASRRNPAAPARRQPERRSSDSTEGTIVRVWSLSSPPPCAAPARSPRGRRTAAPRRVRGHHPGRRPRGDAHLVLDLVATGADRASRSS